MLICFIMSKRYVHHVSHLLLFTTCLVFTLFQMEIKGVQYGPSIEFLTRSDNHGSSKVRGKTLYLSAYPSKSVVAPLLDDKISADPKTAFNFFHHFHFAQFIVEAPTDHRIMAVIQTLKLDTANASFSGCLDHIQFADLQTGNETESICGRIDSADQSEFPKGLIGPRHFSSGNHMAVEVFIISASLPSQNRTTKWSAKELAIEISFTALSLNPDCKAHFDTNDSKIGQEDSGVSCSLSNPQSACMPQNLFCNGVVNCGGTDMMGNDLDFGLDEQNCSAISEVVGHFYDVDEDSIHAEVKYREELVKIETAIEDNIVRYAVMGLSFTVLGILVISCICYWGIWWFPSGDKKDSDKDSELGESTTSKSDVKGIDLDGYKISSMKYSEPRDNEEDVETDEDEFDVQLPNQQIPVKVMANPDGSRSIVSYHEGRRLTICLT